MDYDFSTLMKSFSLDYNQILDNKIPIDISKEKFLQLLDLLQKETVYSKGDIISRKEIFENQQDLLIEYHRICNTLYPVNYKGFVIYFKCNSTSEEFSQENANNYTIEDIEIFYQFTKIENLKDSIYLIDNLLQLMDSINRIFIQEDNNRDRRSFIRRSKVCQSIEIYQYTQEKTLTFLHSCIECLKYLLGSYKKLQSQIPNYISCRYTLGDSFIKMNLPFEIVEYPFHKLVDNPIYNIDHFIDTMYSLSLTEEYNLKFKDFIDEDYSKYDKKWKTTKSSRNVTEQ